MRRVLLGAARERGIGVYAMTTVERFDGERADDRESFVLALENIQIASYVPPESITGDPTEVHMNIHIGGMDNMQLVVRFHGHETISHFIEALTTHREHVWPRTRAERRRRR